MTLDRIRLEFWSHLKEAHRFLNLFMHWSWNVRTSFYRFLLYSIHYLHARKVSPGEESIREAYQELSKPNKTAADEKEAVSLVLQCELAHIFEKLKEVKNTIPANSPIISGMSRKERLVFKREQIRMNSACKKKSSIAISVGDLDIVPKPNVATRIINTKSPHKKSSADKMDREESQKQNTLPLVNPIVTKMTVQLKKLDEELEIPVGDLVEHYLTLG